ncbi:hypothetical protein SGLAM104S_09381 [Streptomyces glaucescens]
MTMSGLLHRSLYSFARRPLDTAMALAPQRADVPVTIDESKCIDGCTLCVDMCPLDSLAIDTSSGKAYMHVDECWDRWPCAAAVPPARHGQHAHLSVEVPLP